ncbi:MAG: TetR/AcrR family transcriptional regulator, partial [Anaerolineae bacterium]|nr:TetR/AcrR family transcriptional regulator [Anaerolineae bacterium]
ELAIEEFAEKSYRSASISRIVARAGIAKGSFYQYFEDKADLYRYLIQLSIQEKQRFFEAHPPPRGETDIFDWLRWLAKAGLDFQFTNPRLARVTYRAIYEDAPLPDVYRTAIQESGKAFFEPLVQRGITQGRIDPNLDPDLVVFIFSALLTQLGEHLMQRLGIPREALLDQGARALDDPALAALLTDLITILERGLRPHDAAPE